jgi:hypothetical protein
LADFTLIELRNGIETIQIALRNLDHQLEGLRSALDKAELFQDSWKGANVCKRRREDADSHVHGERDTDGERKKARMS